MTPYWRTKRYRGETLWWRLCNHGRISEVQELPQLSRLWRRLRFRLAMWWHGEKLVEPRCVPAQVVWVTIPIETPSDTSAVPRHVEALIAHVDKPPQPKASEPKPRPIRAEDLLRFVAKDGDEVLANVTRKAGEMGAPNVDEASWYVEEFIEITGIRNGAEFWFGRFVGQESEVFEHGTV